MPPKVIPESAQIAFRVPEPWITEAERLAEEMTKAGFHMSRTDILRRAVAMGLEKMKSLPSSQYAELVREPPCAIPPAPMSSAGASVLPFLPPPLRLVSR